MQSFLGCLNITIQRSRVSLSCSSDEGMCRFLELVEELFTNVRRLSQTLKKLNKAGAGGGHGTAVGDDDKIYLQVCACVGALLALNPGIACLFRFLAIAYCHPSSTGSRSARICVHEGQNFVNALDASYFTPQQVLSTDCEIFSLDMSVICCSGLH